MEKTPLFIKIEHYEDVLEIMNMIKGKLADVKHAFGKIEQLKAEEDAKIDAWHKSIEEIEARLVNMDQMLVEPEK